MTGGACNLREWSSVPEQLLEEDLPTDGLTFEPDVMREMVEMGRDRAREVLDA